MIDFRYYVVAITAIFTALIAGLLLGSSISTSELVKKQQETLVKSIKKDIETLRKEVIQKTGEVEEWKNYQSLAKRWLMSERLSGKTIGIIFFSEASSDSQASEVRKELEAAGAQVVEIRFSSEPTETTYVSQLIKKMFSPEAQKFLEAEEKAGRFEVRGSLRQMQEVLIVVNKKMMEVLEKDENFASLPPLRSIAGKIEDGKKFLELAPKGSSCVIFDGDDYDGEALVLSFYSEGGIFGEFKNGARIIPEAKRKNE